MLGLGGAAAVVAACGDDGNDDDAFFAAATVLSTSEDADGYLRLIAIAIAVARSAARCDPGRVLSARGLNEPHPERLAPGDPWRGPILDAHAAAVDAGEPGYLDPRSGLFVLTAAALAARGTCCDQGCRHCPYC